jgi:simple sugar transport system ATP-binding protein
MKQQNPFLKMENISKSFGRIQALKNVDFIVNHREIVGLLGDNGAGKTTLIKILNGIYFPDEGTIYFNGKKTLFPSSKAARAMGIETVYQDLALVELMSISRNFFLGREPIKRMCLLRILDKRKMDNIVGRTLKEIGIQVRSPDEPVSHLSGGERQSVAIGRSMHFGARLLILDEPTASLSIKEVNKVLKYASEARDSGLSVIFISHNVHHVFSIADRCTILERGEKLGDFRKEDVSVEQLSEMIALGKDITRT